MEVTPDIVRWLKRGTLALERIADALEDLTLQAVTEEVAAAVFGDGPFPDDDVDPLEDVKWGSGPAEESDR